jgi:hypothetical protein
MLRTIWGDNERYVRTYWEKFQNRYYVAGDSAHRDKDGCFWIMGRIDDVLNVAGHRLGTMEIESALVAHPRIAEAAVVGRPHEIKGEAVSAFVVCRGARPGAEAGALAKELREWVGEQLGAIAKPDDIRFADNLPKTRSGKIMRRLLRAIARGDEITEDVSTLENPAIIDQLRGPPAGTTGGGAAPQAAGASAGTAKARAQSKAKAKAKPTAKSKTRAKSKPEAKSKPTAKATLKAKSGAKVGSRAGTRSKPQGKAKARLMAKPRQAKPKTKPKAKARTNARTKAKTKGAAKARPAPKTTSRVTGRRRAVRRRARPARAR